MIHESAVEARDPLDRQGAALDRDKAEISGRKTLMKAPCRDPPAEERFRSREDNDGEN